MTIQKFTPPNTEITPSRRTPGPLADLAAKKRLEAAAPDLLAAVKVAKDFFINPGSFNPLDVERMYEAAISKAEKQP